MVATERLKNIPDIDKFISRAADGHREQLNGVLSHLSNEELRLVHNILDGKAPGVLDTMMDKEYEEIPISPEQFFTDPYYLGRTGCDLYPVVLDDLIEACEGGYTEIVLGGCLAYDTIVQGADGSLRTLEERLGESNDVGVLSDFGYTSAACSVVGPSGTQKVLEITLSNGMSIRATPDHKIRSGVEVCNWFRADKLQVGDLVNVAGRIRTKPSHSMDEEDAVDLATWGFRVPDVVCRSPDRVVAAYIRRLWVDLGKTHAGFTHIKRIPERFARQLQLLLLRFGVYSSIYPKGGYWDIEVRGVGPLAAFIECVGGIDEAVLDMDLASHDVPDGKGRLYIRITSIVACDEPVHVGDVRDVEEHSSWLANGISVHNSMGWGKSIMTEFLLLRLLYETLCLRNPAKSFGLMEGSSIVIVNISVTEKQAKKAIFTGILNKVRMSPFFKEVFPYDKAVTSELRFPKDVTLFPGASSNSAIIGLDVIGGAIDEVNFMQVSGGRGAAAGDTYDKAQTLYTAMLRRIKTRFTEFGKLPGRLVTPSSAQYPGDFVDRRMQAALSDPSVFVRCLHGDTVIPLMDGTAPTIKELADTRSDDTFEVYSFDAAKGCIIPGTAHSPRLTGEKQEVFCVTLDNGDSVTATAEHPFLLKSGEYCELRNLSEGASIMPLYRRDGKRGYEEVAQPWWGGRYQSTHHLSAKHAYGTWDKKGPDGLPTVIHHIDHNKRNNITSNLVQMSWTDHRKHHCKYVDLLVASNRTPEARKRASEHMKRLHKDPEFAARRDRTGAENLAKLRADPVFYAKHYGNHGKRIAAFHKTPLGRVRQVERNNSRWDKQGRKTNLPRILEAAAEGVRVGELAAEFGCSVSSIAGRLTRAGLPTYATMLKTSPTNHSVVSIVSAGTADVYDLSVDEVHNFAVGAGVFVHNSYARWDTSRDKYSPLTFPVEVGTDMQGSRILTGSESPDTILGQVIYVPMDFKRDFEQDLDGSIRDLAGVSTLTVDQFIKNYSKVLECVATSTPRKHPYTAISTTLVDGEKLYRREYLTTAENGKPVLKFSPDATRVAHIDPSLTGDATGLCVGHISEMTKVERRQPNGSMQVEYAPKIHIDLMLQITPPKNGEIQLDYVRDVIYNLIDDGMDIRLVTMDSFQSAGSLQMFNRKGIMAELLSMDKKTDPYDTLKQALYEVRVDMYEYQPVLHELRRLEFDPRIGKVDHPPNSSKDLADALAGVVYTLTRFSSKLHKQKIGTTVF